MQPFFDIVQWASVVAGLALLLAFTQRGISKDGNSLLERLLGTLRVRLSPGMILMVLVVAFLGTIFYNILQFALSE